MEDAMPVKEFTWFIEPLTDFTNEYISRELPAENAERSVLCSDGKKHNLWRCAHRFIWGIQYNMLGPALRYNVFVRQGHGGEIRLAKPFLYTRKKKYRPSKKLTRKLQELTL